MSDAPAPVRRRRAARAIVAVFGSLFVGVGVTIFATVPATTPTANIPCYGDRCVMCVEPTLAQCLLLTRCGGDPCQDNEPGGDPYAGAAGRIARGLRELKERGAIETWHTDVVSTLAGAVTDCATVVYMSPDQRAAARRTINASGVGSQVTDCRFANASAKFKRNGVRRSVLDGATADMIAGSNESAPDDTVSSLDAGPE